MSNLENSNQASVISESENMDLDQESQGHLESFSEDHQEPISEDVGDRKEGVDDRDEGMKKSGHSPQFENFKASFDSQPDPESKLQLAIDFMESSLSQGGIPHFRSFWEARRLCLPLFKENINPTVRSYQWTRYSEISKEARRLKDILDEQSAFAVEQIEIAIHALEHDIAQFDENVEKTSFPDSVPFPYALKEHMSIYHGLQKQLNLLNTQASRINALRKELLKTEMRVRHKNKFFQRLSAAGDLVFPKRKELIKQISNQFSKDVTHFIKKHFEDGESQESLFNLREDIKALQGLAKVLTLNTHTFTETRTQLSQCWDQLKTEERERKKERAQQRVAHKQNYDEINQQIQDLKTPLEKNEISHIEAQKKVEAIVTRMREVEIAREDLKGLRDGVAELRKIIQEKVKEHEVARTQLEQEREKQKREKYFGLRERAELLVKEHDSFEADQLVSKQEELLELIHSTALSKNEKQELERLLKPMRDIIADKKEKALMTLSDDDRQALQQLKTVLQQRKERRQEVKNQLEQLRKMSGSSHLDFEKAISCKQQIEEERERLDKANSAIEEVEEKIRQLQAKIKKG